MNNWILVETENGCTLKAVQGVEGLSFEEANKLCNLSNIYSKTTFFSNEQKSEMLADFLESLPKEIVYSYKVTKKFMPIT